MILPVTLTAGVVDVWTKIIRPLTAVRIIQPRTKRVEFIVHLKQHLRELPVTRARSYVVKCDTRRLQCVARRVKLTSYRPVLPKFYPLFSHAVLSNISIKIILILRSVPGGTDGGSSPRQ